MSERDIGRLEGRMDSVESDVQEMKKDVKEILEVMNQAKGGWKTLVIVGTISGTIGAFIGKFVPFINVTPR